MSQEQNQEPLLARGGGKTFNQRHYKKNKMSRLIIPITGNNNKLDLGKKLF